MKTTRPHPIRSMNRIFNSLLSAVLAALIIPVVTVRGDEGRTDVTAKVAAAIVDQELFILANNENFGDPAEGVIKKLKVEFTINDKAQTKIAEEENLLHIPSLPGEKLVISKAIYGTMEDAATETDCPVGIVTTIVAAAVKDGKLLSLSVENESLQGDPVPDHVKQIKVNYTVGGKPFSVTANEGESLSLPGPGPGQGDGALVITRAIYGVL